MGRKKSDSDPGVRPPPQDIPTAGKDYELYLPKGYLSFTQIDMYIRCPQQYQFRYVDGRKDPPGIALVEGSAHHTTLEYNHRHMMRQHESRPYKELIDKFVDAFDANSGDVGDWGGIDRDTVIGRGKGMLQSYHTEVAPKLRPVAVEEEIGLEIAGVPVLGYLDVRTVARFLDFKTCSKHRSQNDVNNALQMMLYSLGCKKPRGMIVELNKKTLGIRVHMAEYWRSSIEFHVARIVSRVAAAISHGDFPPTAPTNWVCNPKWCGYYDSCRGSINVGWQGLVTRAKIEPPAGR